MSKSSSEQRAQINYEVAQKLDESFDGVPEAEKENHLNKMLKHYMEAAKLGHVEAHHCLGLYFQTHGLMEEAIKYYKVAADAGYSASQCNLGLICLGLFGGSPHYGAAISYLKSSAAQGNANAKINLAMCYEHGCGVSVNKERADKLLKEAAEGAGEDVQLCTTKLPSSAPIISSTSSQSLVVEKPSYVINSRS